MSALRQAKALFLKDVRVELRTREVLSTALLFAIVLVTLFVFSGFSEVALMREAAPGVMWVCIAFLGTLVFGRTFQREREERAIAGLLLVPGVLDGLFFAKLGVNLLLLAVVEALLIPAVALAFRLDLIPVLGPFLGVVALANLGYATLGTVLSAALASVRLREVILPLVLFPLILPLMVCGVSATSALIGQGAEAPIAPYIQLLVAFDLLFLALSRWLFSEAVDPRR